MDLDLWPKKEDGTSKYEVMDWQDSPTIGAVLVQGTEDRGEQAGLSLRKDTYGDSLTIGAVLVNGTEDGSEQAGPSLRKDSSGDQPK